MNCDETRKMTKELFQPILDVEKAEENSVSESYPHALEMYTSSYTVVSSDFPYQQQAIGLKD
jgi:hypothetical protein